MVVTKKQGVESQIREMPRGVEHPQETAKNAGKDERAAERVWTKGDLEFHAIGSTKLVLIINDSAWWRVTFRDDGMLGVHMRNGEAVVDPKKLPRGDESVTHSTLSGEHDKEFVAIAKIAVSEQERIKKQLPPRMR